MLLVYPLVVFSAFLMVMMFDLVFLLPKCWHFSLHKCFFMLVQILVLLQVEILPKEVLAFLLVFVLEMLILEKIIVFVQVERLVFHLEYLILFWPVLME